MASALSTEQTSSRIRMVSNSTFARETRMSPAITSPLSSTRSRISSRFAVPETVGTLCIISQEKTEEIAWDWENPSDSCHRILTSPTINCQPLIAFSLASRTIRKGGGPARTGVRCREAQNWLSGLWEGFRPCFYRLAIWPVSRLIIYQAGSPEDPTQDSGLPASAQRLPQAR